jgi:hypothetical protein
VLVTTRDALVATLPIDDGLEVHEFNVEDGARFLLAMAHKRKRTSDEAEASQEVAKQLGGLPLALNQMAALINARNCSIREFQAMHAKYEQRLHKQRKSGWKYLGNQHSLDTVWEMSFQNLGPELSQRLELFVGRLCPLGGVHASRVRGPARVTLLLRRRAQVSLFRR